MVQPASAAHPGGNGLIAFVSDRGRDRVRVYELDGRGAAAGPAVVRDVTDPGARPVFSSSEEEVDDQHTATNEEERRNAGELLDLLTPIVKAFLTMLDSSNDAAGPDSGPLPDVARAARPGAPGFRLN